MKRRLTALITAFVILSSFAGGMTAFASLRGTSCENEAALLCALGIFPDGAVTGFNTSDSVTRQEFAEYVEKALGETDQTVAGYTEKFTDFTADGYIAKGVFDGFITGYPDGSFKPSQRITASEAKKMVIDASGYRYLAALKGEYPDSYTALASEIGLSKNVSRGAYAEIDLKDAVFLIYNMLNLKIPLVSADGKGISFENDKTILSEKFNVKKGSGIISANEYTALTSPVGISKGDVEIDGVVYGAGISGAENYLGYNVEFYYLDEKGDYTIVYVDPAKKSDDLRIYADEIDRLENDKYYYYDGDNATKTTAAAISATADVIYNGKAMPEIDDNSIYTPEYGNVTLIDNNRDGKYDVVSITDRNVIVLNMYDDNEYIFYDKYDSQNTVSIDPDSSKSVLRIRNSQGAEVQLEALTEWDVLEIAQSADGELTDIIVHRESFSGVIRSVGSDYDGKQLLTVDSKEYEVSAKLTAYNESKQTPFRNLQSYNFILNSDGIIVGYNTNVAVVSDGSYGYLISVKRDDVEDTFFLIKMLTADSEIKTFKTTEKPRIDGQTSKSTIEAYGKMPLNPMIIYYKTDADGLIKELDTVERSDKETVNSLMVKGSVQDAKYSGSHRTISAKINLKDDSLVFIVPNDVAGASEKEFEVKPATEYFKHYQAYTATGYSRDIVSPYSDAVLVRDTVEAEINRHDDIYLVQKISSGINSDDEEVAVLEIINGSGTKEYITDSMETLKSAKSMDKMTTVGVETGDAIMISQNKNGEINCINVIYRPSDGSFYPNNNPSAGNDYLSAFRVGLWDVFYKTDKYLRVVSAGSEFTDAAVENLEIANVFVYEPDNKTPYRAGTANEVRDYYSTKMASRVLARTNDANTQIIVIYNKNPN